MLPAVVEVRLQEWARAVRDDGAPRRSCGSLEGNWRSPQWWDSPPLTPAPVNPERVREVERAVVAQPEPFRTAIVCIYVREEPAAIACGHLRRWNVREMAPVLAEALRRVGIALAGGDRSGGRARSSLTVEIAPRSAFYAALNAAWPAPFSCRPCSFP